MLSIQVLTIRSWRPLVLVRSRHNLSKNFSRSGMTESRGCPVTNETNETNGTRDLTFERWQWNCIMEIKICKCTYCICWISHFMFFIVAFSSGYTKLVVWIGGLELGARPCFLIFFVFFWKFSFKLLIGKVPGSALRWWSNQDFASKIGWNTRCKTCKTTLGVKMDTAMGSPCVS